MLLYLAQVEERSVKDDRVNFTAAAAAAVAARKQL